MKLILLVKKLLGLVEMTFGLVNASFNLPEWQAVNIFFLHAEYNNFTISVEYVHILKMKPITDYLQ